MNNRHRAVLKARFGKIGFYRKYNSIIKSIENVLRKGNWRCINDLKAKDLIPVIRTYIPRTEYIKIEFDIDDPAIQKKAMGELGLSAGS